ncbi:MAG: universal stress protein [Methylomicrobium sp.]|nr:universal stress protein [Methylomicrobium sp.]
MNTSLNACKIIVPVDFSEFSVKAFVVANDLAQLFKGRVTPFHSYDLSSNLDGFHYQAKDFRVDGDLLTTHDELEKHLMDYAADYIDYSILDPAVAERNPRVSEAIFEAAETFDLIVMSSHGRTGFKRMLMGSVAEKVLHSARHPVIIAGRETGFSPVEKIVYTTDFSENSYAALPYVAELAGVTGAAVDVFHAICGDFSSVEYLKKITQEREEQLQILVRERLAGLARVNCVVVPGEDSAHHAIRKYYRDKHYNVLIMASCGRSGHDFHAVGSTTTAMVRSTNATIMVVKPDMGLPEA